MRKLFMKLPLKVRKFLVGALIVIPVTTGANSTFQMSDIHIGAVSEGLDF